MPSLILSLFMISPIVHAKNTTWMAGTRYKGQVTVVMQNHAKLRWKCNGSVCRVTGSFGEQLSLEACQGLVRHTGPLRFYKNTHGQIWSYKSAELAQCNAVHTKKHQ
ncbi:hypothetical protein EWP19_05335 [Acinetobacter piscicola]|nr:hypothetical protein EWP19_05335 [Acinetobacter piscicola]